MNFQSLAPQHHQVLLLLKFKIDTLLLGFIAFESYVHVALTRARSVTTSPILI